MWNNTSAVRKRINGSYLPVIVILGGLAYYWVALMLYQFQVFSSTIQYKEIAENQKTIYTD